MKKVILSVLTAAGMLLLPFAGAAAAVTGTFTAVVTTPNGAGTTITFPSFSGGVTGVAGAQATGSFTVAASSTTGSTTSITVNGTELLGSSVGFTTDAAGTASALAAAINANASTSSYTALASGSTVTVTGPAGSSLNGADFVFTSSGDLAFTTTPFSGGTDATGGVSATTTSSHFAAVATSTTNLSLNIGSTTVSLTAGDTAAQAAAAVAAAINANVSAPYTASVTNTDEVTLTQKTSGSAGNVAVIASDLSYNGSAEVVTFTPANVTAGETFRATINGTHYDALATGTSTVASISAALAAEMNANAAVSCTASGTDITCTSANPGTAFTASATVLAGGFPFLFPVSIHSSNSNAACAKLGDTVTLTFTSDTALGASSTVMIEGQNATITPLGGNMYSATITLNGSSTPGLVTFMISPFDNSNVAASSTSQTTDNSSVSLNTSAPTITLSGNSQLNWQFTRPFEDPGVTAVDNSGATTTVHTSGNVDVNTPGTYTVTYVSTDCAGNTATSTRTVTVNPPLQAGSSSGNTPNSANSSNSSSGATGITIGGVVVSAILLPPLTIGPSVPLIPNTGVEEFSRVLMIGMSGDDVAGLQEKLAETGYLHVSPTGYFGSLTKSALMRLQAANGLAATGVFDAATMEFMSS